MVWRINMLREEITPSPAFAGEGRGEGLYHSWPYLEEDPFPNPLPHSWERGLDLLL